MCNWRVEHWTGAAGIAGAVLQLVAFVVFFIAGRPAKAEADLAAFLHSGSTALQTSFLLFFVAFAVWFLFFAGLRALLVGADPGLDFLGTAMFGLGAAAVILGHRGPRAGSGSCSARSSRRTGPWCCGRHRVPVRHRNAILGSGRLALVGLVVLGGLTAGEVVERAGATRAAPRARPAC